MEMQTRDDNHDHDPGRIVVRYLERMVAHDWDAMAGCLAEDVVRVGPFGDTYTPRDPYVAFLSELMPSLPGYSMRIGRVLSSGRSVVVELTEVVEIGGSPLETPEVLVFDLDMDGRITHIAIYIQRLGEVPAMP
jgi:ketosteroid isomerase-like protein